MPEVMTSCRSACGIVGVMKQLSLGLVGLVLTLSAASSASQGQPATLLAAGDIADCSSSGDEATAKLLEGKFGTIAALGDLVYPGGSLERYRKCYAPSWGQFLNRTRPALGNHDVQEDGGAGYFAYFGSPRAGTPGAGFYRYDLGAWRVIVLNSNCWMKAAGCRPDSPQTRWLEETLKNDPRRCTIAYWHHPRYSSGLHGSSLEVKPLFEVLYRAGVDLALTGHDHLYERFAPMDANGNADSDGGLRQFVVGTGGKSHYPVRAVQPNSQVRLENTDGILDLSLEPDRYAWRFVTTAGKVGDAGRDVCH
jgi:acid phosphatase type 7